MAAMAIFHLSLSLLLHFLIFCTHAQFPNTTIELGSRITSGSNTSWQSPSGNFAFGFYPITGNRYLVGIWFNKIPEKTLVWSANRNDTAEENSTIILKATGEFILLHANETEFSIYNGTATSSATMLDGGNFELRDSTAKPIWRSFGHPTDTLLPGQVLSMEQKIYSNANGISDYSIGKFMLHVQLDGNAVMSSSQYAEPAYWYTATSGLFWVKGFFKM